MFGIILMSGKRSHADISTDTINEGEGDGDKTPTNPKGNREIQNDIPYDSDEEDGGKTPTNESISEEEDEISDIKETLELIERLERGEYIHREDLENIKEEYASYFEEDNVTEKEALKQIKESLEGELSVFGKKSLDGLMEALEEASREIHQEYSEEPSEEPLKKRVKSSEASTSTEITPETIPKPSDGLGPSAWIAQEEATRSIFAGVPANNCEGPEGATKENSDIDSGFKNDDFLSPEE